MMAAGFFITLFWLGLFGGFLSGLLGLGGGIIMVPLLLYVPPALGVGSLSMKTVAGMTSVQSLFGAASGALAHRRYGHVNMPLALFMGGAMGFGSLAGSVVSKFVSAQVILLVFASMAFVASVLMFFPHSESGPEVPVGALAFNKPLAVTVGLVIGLLSGIIGQGGAFLFIPAMLYILRVPTRVTIGSALIIGMISSVCILIGRIGTHQVPYLEAGVLVAGVLLGAQVGARVSQKTHREALRRILAVIIAATAIKIWYEVLIII